MSSLFHNRLFVLAAVVAYALLNTGSIHAVPNAPKTQFDGSQQEEQALGPAVESVAELYDGGRFLEARENVLRLMEPVCKHGTSEQIRKLTRLHYLVSREGGWWEEYCQTYQRILQKKGALQVKRSGMVYLRLALGRSRRGDKQKAQRIVSGIEADPELRLDEYDKAVLCSIRADLRVGTNPVIDYKEAAGWFGKHDYWWEAGWAYNNLGVLLQERENSSEAAMAYRQALTCFVTAANAADISRAGANLRSLVQDNADMKEY